MQIDRYAANADRIIIGITYCAVKEYAYRLLLNKDVERLM